MKASLPLRVRSTVAETVQRQAEAGVPVLDDWEQGKPGYSAYVKDGLTGFEGEGTAAAVSGEPRTSRSTPPGARKSRLKRPAWPGPWPGRIGTPCARTLKICRPL